MPDYRPVPDDLLEEYHRLQDYAFSPQEGRREYESPDDFRPQLAERRGLFRGEDLLCIAGYHDFEARLRGDRFRVGGVSSVASPPEHRRGGLIRRILADMLAEFREKGIALSALWPFEYGFYRKYGWATVDRRTSYEFDPDALSFVDREEATGEFRRADADEYAVLDGVYEAALADYDLVTRRDEAWWRNRIFERRGDEAYVYVWEADGEARGYLVYTISQTDGERSRTLSVREFVHADPEARRALYRFLRYHDSQVDRVAVPVPEETTLLDLVDDPRAVDCSIEPGPMFRLVDVSAAIEMLPYDPAVSGGLTVAVDDPLVDANDGSFALSFDEGRATCRPTDADPDVACDVGTLSQLYAGYRSATDAAELGDLAVETPDALDLLASAFPERPTYLPERF